MPSKSPGRKLPAGAVLRFLSILASVASLSCVGPEAALMAGLWNRESHVSVEEGTVTLRDGDEARVNYRHAFQSPPELIFIGFQQSWAKSKPYGKADFSFTEQAADHFKVQNNHREAGDGCWAVIKWRATGVQGNAGTGTPQQQRIARIQALGGKITYAPDRTIIGIDLHHRRVTDADLASLEDLTSLQTLNLYATPISNAGLVHVAHLTNLQHLFLNDTAITDEGLKNLQPLVHLKQLTLYQTQVTDRGLAALAPLSGLEDLTLGGDGFTDQGIVQLKALRHLKRLLLIRTHVTRAGVYPLQRSLPSIQVVGIDS